MSKIGIIGGTGIYCPDFLTETKEKKVKTPFGEPSSELISGNLGKNEVVMLFRHGKGHAITPSFVNYRANIFSLKDEGCDYIIATTACGSLREEIERGDMVFPDQFIDFTKARKTTYFEHFEGGEMKHTPMADPFSDFLKNKLFEAAENLKIKCHKSATLITIEGPRFSSRAESEMFRLWGADLINMTTATEVILANEMAIPYAAIALSTDYDCWKTNEAPVSFEEVLRVFNQNLTKLVQLLKNVIPEI